MIGIDTHHTGLRGAGAITALVLTGVLIAGCGSSSKGTTVAQFKRDVNAECTAVRNDKSAAAEVAKIDKSKASTAEKSLKILAFTAPYYKKFEAIRPPAKDATADQMHVAYTAIAAAIASASSGTTNTTTLDTAGSTISTDETILRDDYAKIGASSCE